MFGDSFFTCHLLKTLCSQISRFRPHVWGFFFHNRKGKIMATFGKKVFVPMFGDSFFTSAIFFILSGRIISRFRPHVWGFFFHKDLINMMKRTVSDSFSSPCLGILFSPGKEIASTGKGAEVFVPMFGDSFFTGKLAAVSSGWCCGCFRPHAWGFFFHSRPGMPHGVGSLWPFCGGDFQLIGILIIFTL